MDELSPPKPPKKLWQKCVRALAWFAGILLALNLLGLGLHQAFWAQELKGMAPYGRLVDVDGKKMHLHSAGEGEKTIVLLAGFGVSLPSASFGPLMRALSQKHKVVVVEYLGVGFSEEATTPRSNENYVQEMRKALSVAGFSPPYVLMPHSISGVYAEYYAAKYPNEIEAMVMLEPTPTTLSAESIEQKLTSSASSLKFSKYMQDMGVSRMLLALGASKFMSEEMGYSKEEIAHFKRFANHSINKTLLEQSAYVRDNILEVQRTVFPDTVPVLRVLATEGMQQTLGEAALSKHLERLGANATSFTLDGSHFIYHMRVQEIVEATQGFLRGLPANAEEAKAE